MWLSWQVPVREEVAVAIAASAYVEKVGVTIVASACERGGSCGYRGKCL